MATNQALSRADKVKITRLRSNLLRWYATNGRDFPWRRDSTSVFERICVEVLLQRTRAETVSSMYGTFFGRFRSWEEIAGARIDELEEQFKPIGLWRRRARSMHGLATYAADHRGIFPSTETGLAKVPAVGQYVANAILLFQHGRRRPLLDVNMARVLERHVRPRRLADIRHDPWLQAAARWLVRDGDPAIVNWATLDFASTTCKPRNPACPGCTVSRTCQFLVTGSASPG
ncbi:hypothetical protein [Minwuia thermotolerans]|uniref:hypothetical protein n=1 Tax=Minwuia thermotolerans TaxID=2056226 RepID=UPI000D6DC53F|nr:hypothetical protein [Minwuia thermotolerans]